jgi:YidC/Oxa1 family membrane protein insertase
VEKRVPIALFLCFLVTLVWVWMSPPPEQRPGDPDLDTAGEAFRVDAESTLGSAALDPGDAESTDGSEVQDGAAAPGAPESQEALQGSTGQGVQAPEAVAAAQPEELVLVLGRPGQPGYQRAVFSNRGAQLVELRSGNFFDRTDLTEEERADPEHWVRLVDSVRTPTGRTGSLLWVADRSAEDLTGGANLASALWEMERLTFPDGRDRGVQFTFAPGNGAVFTKRIESVELETVDGLVTGSYDFEVTLGLANEAAPGDGSAPKPRDRDFLLRTGAVMEPEYEEAFYQGPKAVAVGGRGDKLKHDDEIKKTRPSKQVGRLDVPAPLQLVGVHNKYFAFLWRAIDEDGRATLTNATWQRLADLDFAEENPSAKGRAFLHITADVNLRMTYPAPGERREWRYRVWAGPKDHAGFQVASPAHEEVLVSDLGWFSGLGRFLVRLLIGIEALVGNWGVAIIVLTLLVRLVLFPINRRSQTAMARYQTKMKRVQPRIEAIKEKYKEDPKALQQAQAKLMQEEGLFPPLGGCLPLFLQMPIFFGLFSALRTSFELRQAPFAGWITDLARPDRLVDFGEGSPVQYLNLLPILMVVMWIWQQRSMPQATDEQAKQMQRIMLFMPLVMGVFLYNYAAGLSLYMVTSSTFALIEIKVIKKVWPIDDTELEKKPNKGCAPFAARLQEMAEKQQAQQEALRKQKGQVRDVKGQVRSSSKTKKRK